MLQTKNFLRVIATILMIIGLVNGLFLLSKSGFLNQVKAKNNQKIVTVFDGSNKKVTSVNQAKVREILQALSIELRPSDVVEPELDYLVDSDIYINIYRATPVTIIDGNNRLKIITPHKQVKQIVEDSGNEFYDEDQAKIKLEPLALDQDLGVQLVVERAKTVELDLYGKVNQIRTNAKTVDQLLKQKQLKLTDKHKLNCQLDQPIVEKMKLEIWQEGTQTKIEEQEIPFEIEKIYNYDKPASYSKIKTAGVKGKKVANYKVEIKNKQEISRKLIDEVIIEKPVKQIIEVGVKGVFNTPSKNENLTWDFLRQQGFTREQTAGIMGNLMQEHRFRTTDMPSGLGIAQWIGVRRTRLINRYPETYLSIDSQLEYMMFELNKNGLTNKIKQAQTVEQALIIFQNQFERCGVCMQNRRMQYAMNILASH